MKIRLRKDDISCGEQGSTVNCPIARCLRRKMGINKLHVDTCYVDIGEIRIDLPLIARRFIICYDRAKNKNKIAPITFNINVPKNN